MFKVGQNAAIIVAFCRQGSFVIEVRTMQSNFPPPIMAEPVASGPSPLPQTRSDLESKASKLLCKMLGEEVKKPMDLIKLVREGIAPSRIDELVRRSEGILSPTDTGFVIARRTLSHRKRKGESLNQEESERMVRLAKVAARAAAVFGDQDKARKWLHKPLKAFDGESALDLIQYEEGQVIVQDYLNRLDSGFFA